MHYLKSQNLRNFFLSFLFFYVFQLNAALPSATVLSGSPNPSFSGQTVNLTAMVSPSIATGTVAFFNGLVFFGTAPVIGGTATLSAAFTSTSSLTATYSGDVTFNPSTSPPFFLFVLPRTTTTTLSVSPNPSNVGQTVNLTAVVTPSIATGTVTFFDGATAIGTVPVSGGTATFPTQFMVSGTHSITAVYSGDVGFDSSTSSIVILVVNENVVFPPSHLRGIQKRNKCVIVNILLWQPPLAGIPPVGYRIYSDASLTKLIGKVSNKKLMFRDRFRQKQRKTYYVISVDANGLTSVPAKIVFPRR